MDKPPWDWDRADLDLLLGQTETVRREFKVSRVLEEGKGTGLEKIAEKLSAEVSAFANTEGGVLIIGVKERREGRSRVAETIDEGVDIALWSPERLQAFIEGNVSPYLTGLRIRLIPLDATRTKGVYVVSVPQGTTAYQASDHKYYGRSEFEAKALPDHEVRLRMFRGKAAVATIQCEYYQKATRSIDARDRYKLRRLAINNTFETEGLDEVDIYYFRVVLRNIGELNITDYKASFFASPEALFQATDFQYAYRDGGKFGSGPGYEGAIIEVNIYPQDTYRIEDFQITVPKGIDLDIYQPRLDWTLYLRDSYPTQGKLVLSTKTVPYKERD